MQHTNFSCVHFLNLERNKQKWFLSYFNAVRLSQCLMLSVDVTLLISRMLQQLCVFSAVLFVLRTGSSNLQLLHRAECTGSTVDLLEDHKGLTPHFQCRRNKDVQNLAKLGEYSIQRLLQFYQKKRKGSQHEQFTKSFLLKTNSQTEPYHLFWSFHLSCWCRSCDLTASPGSPWFWN